LLDWIATDLHGPVKSWPESNVNSDHLMVTVGSSMLMATCGPVLIAARQAVKLASLDVAKLEALLASTG
jgi:hypothetical protein